ncbi:MAG: DUF1538 domain-containing protein [Ruminococcaceae bacterium]|nr:DUF1538 domain-containing protein [Oscillospiraceae bacterium]
MHPTLKQKTNESLAAVLPITIIVLALSVFLISLSVGLAMMFFVGAIMLIAGMGMFQLGAEMAMTPLGEGIGVQLPKAKSLPVIIGISFLLGTIITIAEPDLQVLANQVPSIPNIVIILTVAIGVGIFLAVAVLRIIKKIRLSNLLMILYAVVIVLSFFVPQEFLAVGFDSGGVTTGPITVPFIMAIGVGISSVRGDKNAASDSFGLVALSSVGPILAVLLLGCFYRTKEGAYAAADITEVNTVRDVVHAFAVELPHYAEEVFISVIPIVAVFVIFQIISRRYQRRQKLRVAVGFGYTYIGLVLFLCGVNVGFAPVGTILGNELAGSDEKWLLIPIGSLIGYFIVKAEPAIQILNHQIQTVTNGVVSAQAMNRCLSIGVSVSVGLAMLRIITGISIQWIIIPGYIIALIMSKFVPKIFVGIAFDSGGVASGPMTSTFLLPLCIGVCEMLGGNVMTDAFGVVALVALTPLIAVQIMGLAYRYRMAKIQSAVAEDVISVADDDDIIEIEEA